MLGPNLDTKMCVSSRRFNYLENITGREIQKTETLSRDKKAAEFKTRLRAKTLIDRNNGGGDFLLLFCDAAIIQMPKT